MALMSRLRTSSGPRHAGQRSGVRSSWYMTKIAASVITAVTSSSNNSTSNEPTRAEVR